MESAQPKNINLFPKAVSFGFHTADDIRKISVVQVSNPQTFNALGHPTPSGLYDPLMGPWSERADNCATCQSSYVNCPGHYGHIELPLPVYHPLFLRNLIGIIKLTCPACKRFFLQESQKALLTGQLELLDHGLLIPAQQLKEQAHIHDNETDDVDEYMKVSSKSQQARARDGQLKKEIEAVVRTALKECGSLMEDKPFPTRHVEGLRQALIKDFQKRATHAGKCANCDGGWKKIVLYKSRIVFSLKPGTVATAMGGHVMEVPELDETVMEDDFEVDEGKKKSRKSASVMPTTYLTASDARDHLREVWTNDQELFARLFPVLRTTDCEYPTDIFFLDVIPVIPSKFRPVNFTNGSLKENGHSLVLKKIIQDTYVVKTALFAFKRDSKDDLPKEAEQLINSLQGTTLLDKLQSAWLEMQEGVNMIADSSSNKELNAAGFRQVIEKKEGLFRMHMMGKRVNYAARSVITPDPNIGVEEVGVPEVFAKKLTFPTPVTAWNVHELRELVRNGPNIHPGAMFIEEENGRLIRLSPTDAGQRDAAAKTLLTPTEAAIKVSQSAGGRLSHGPRDGLFKPKVVHRHLRNGDVMLLNRQPTLHKPSIMAHKVRVLPGEKTLRLHYANCKAFNADFDGDEMNAHFPQNEVARSEAYNIVAVPYQYLVPKDGTPLSGLIQDHMISGVKLSMRGQFFNRADYQQLVYAGLGTHCTQTKLLPPTIIKPVPLWSGKQILSTIIINLTPKGKPLINIESGAKIGVKDWQNAAARPWRAGGTPLPNAQAMTESQVVIRHGQLLCGVLDKMHYGATSYGLVHSFFELYGGQYSCRLLTSLGRLFTTFLQLRGFTLGVEDILLTPAADQKRRKILSLAADIGNETAARAVGVLAEGDAAPASELDVGEVKRRLAQAHLSRSTLKRMTIDHEFKAQTDRVTNEVNKACIPNGLLQRFPDNNLALMIQSGAKGSSVNAMQISCLLGQIELEGKRPPMMISGRCLPSFLPYDTSPRASGFVAGRFMTGIRPQEFFFHCMAGREGLIDTAVKTSRSGYLQRCLIKHLEGISVAYDQTVRDSDGSVLQFLYGEDGLDIGKSQYLNEKGIPFLVENRDCIRMLDEDLLKQDRESQDWVKAAQKRVKRWARKRGDGNLVNKERRSGFLNYSTLFQVDPDQKDWVGRQSRPGRSLVADQLEEIWRQMEPDAKQAYARKQDPPPDPVNAHYPASRHADVLVERLESLVDKYMEKGNLAVGRKELTRMVYSKAVAASAEPGEPVGILAAQSIGEPSTQMTLNTFHFAGRGDMNVTLGIPRLREILITASAAIQTPSMDIPLLVKGQKGLRKAERLKLKLTRVTLADVLEKVDVTEQLNVAGDSHRSRIYTLAFHFLPKDSYKDRFCVKPKQVMRYFETVFVHRVLLPGIRKEAAAQSLQSLFVAKTAKVRAARSTTGAGGGGDGDGEDGNEADESVAPGGPAGGRGVDDDDDDDDGDSDAEAGDDAGAAAEKQRRRLNDEQEYEDEEDGAGVPSTKTAAAAARTDDGDEGFGDEDDERTATADHVADGADAEAPEDLSAEMEQAVEDRKNQVLGLDDWIVDYEFDASTELWCRLTLSVPLTTQKVDMSSSLRGWAESAVVYQVSKIKRAFVVRPKSEDDDVVIKTDGVNIQAMFKFSKILDLNRLYCNDVHQIAEHYGVEAASQVIVKEVRNVFKVYGITVDMHHLTLVASYMTAGGAYRPFSRYGMHDSTSPLQQMSYETATDFLKNAALQGKTDHLKSPSSRLVVGLPGLEGTGSFDLMSLLY